MIYNIYYAVYNIEYIVYTTFVNMIMARTPPRVLSKRMLVLKFSRAPPPNGGGGHLGFIAGRGADQSTQLQAAGPDRGHTS